MWDLGDTVPLGVDVRNSAGVLVNAATIALTITLPDGSVLTPTPVNPSTGRYEYDHTAAVAGRHLVRWLATSPNAAYTDVFDVDASPAGIISVADAKEYLKIDPADTSQDEEVRGVVGGITAVVEDVCGPVVRRTVVERHHGAGSAVALNQAPILSITSVTESGTLLAAADYSLDDYAILTRVSGYTARRWPPGVNNVVVTYVVGRAVVAPHFIEAAKELVRINFRPQQGGNYMPFDSDGGDDQGLWRLGFFVPHGVLRLLAGDARPPGTA